MTFTSKFTRLATVDFPAFSGLRIMMMPVVIGDKLPESIVQYDALLAAMTVTSGEHVGKVGYLTIDERDVPAGDSHRRGGLHVDSVYRTPANSPDVVELAEKLAQLTVRNTDLTRSLAKLMAEPNQREEIDALRAELAATKRSLAAAEKSRTVYTENRGFAGYGSREHGMLLVASAPGCNLYQGEFDGDTDDEGGCEHLRSQCGTPEPMAPSVVHWIGGMGVHESLPQPVAQRRQLVRLSLPSEAPWHEGNTVSPLGVLPTGPVLPMRRFMKEAA